MIKSWDDFLNEDEAPANFADGTFVHASSKDSRDSIMKLGLGVSDNPVITTGIYTFPVIWDPHNSMFRKSEYDFYYIKLKPGSKICWTDSDRPMDYLFGQVSKEFRPVWEEVLKSTGLKDEKDIMALRTGQSGSDDAWFAWKTKFHRGIEKYLMDNGFAGIQEGGQVVITDMNSIDSIMLDKKIPIKANKDIKFHKLIPKNII